MNFILVFKYLSETSEEVIISKKGRVNSYSLEKLSPSYQRLLKLVHYIIDSKLDLKISIDSNKNVIMEL